MVQTLWVHVDEPVGSRRFDIPAQLDATVAAQCGRLHTGRSRIKGQSGFPRWPATVKPN